MPPPTSTIGANHKQNCIEVKPRLQEHKFPVARHDVVDHLLVALALLELLPHEKPQVFGEWRVGIVDRLVLADKAAKPGRYLARSRLKSRVLELLQGIDGERRPRAKSKEQSDNESLDEVRASLTPPVRALRGMALSRPSEASRSSALRSRSETRPPMNMISAPPQIHRTKGW